MAWHAARRASSNVALAVAAALLVAARLAEDVAVRRPTKVPPASCYLLAGPCSSPALSWRYAGLRYTNQAPLPRPTARPSAAREGFVEPRAAGAPGAASAVGEEAVGEEAVADEEGFPAPGNALAWLLFGVSFVYLAHFASLYTQLPGLLGQSGLDPLLGRSSEVAATWLLRWFPSPELGVEVLTVLGMAVAALQVAWPGAALRRGEAGVASYLLLWAAWNDVVIAGGRFTAYQMDVLLLDVAPLCVLAASGLYEGAALFGLRWAFLRLYLGGGAVKLLSCDESWRNLSALHWHFQSQPLPNPIGSLAFNALPAAAGELSTLWALVVEIATPYLYMAPSAEVRRLAFLLQASLQAGIALAGNFGPFNALTLLLGLSLLEDGDLPPAPGSQGGTVWSRPAPSMLTPQLEAIGTGAAVLSAGLATAWTLHNVGASCEGSWGAPPLVWGALLLAPVGIGACAARFAESLLATVLLLGSAWPLAAGMGVILPLPQAVLQFFNIGAQPYGLFARMTGVGGRPTVVVEAAQDAAGPWLTLPFRYQVMDPGQMPPLCFPHFPRLDWTHWFTPFGGRDSNFYAWLGNFLRGVGDGDRGVTDLLDGPKLRELFPEPPELLRVSPMTYHAVLPGFEGGGEEAAAWWVRAPAEMTAEAWKELSREELVAQTVVFSQEELRKLFPAPGEAPWPGLPGLRPAADGGGEAFVWLWLLTSELARRAGAGERREEEGGRGLLREASPPEKLDVEPDEQA